MERKTYPTDLTDAEWRIMAPYAPKVKGGGRPRVHSIRELLNGIFYINPSGGHWRLLPHDLPPWKTVYHYFRLWTKDGSLEKIPAALRLHLRQRLGLASAFGGHPRPDRSKNAV